jgi:hypothetical protein
VRCPRERRSELERGLLRGKDRRWMLQGIVEEDGEVYCRGVRSTVTGAAKKLGSILCLD